ncbi:MAG TPA: protein arginine kinase [Planctomycetota bacterium]|nr:protein arginine kinase [Planctomycetota bacterium]
MKADMDLNDLQTTAGEWLGGTGPESDIVISSRIRLARNVAEFSFLSRASQKERGQIERRIQAELKKALPQPDICYHSLPPLSPVDRLFLVERHLISREHAYGKGPRGVCLGGGETISIMVNEEDHLRIQGLRSGLQLRATWEQVDEIDTKLEKSLDYAFSPQFGYLTVCPTNVGTGMRASVMLHLPALVMTRQIDKVFQAVSKINLAVRGLYGEGTQASGDFYQFSNQPTLGKSEGEIIEMIERMIPKIIEYERAVREQLLEQKKEVIEDKVWRAYGMLQTARTISSEETMDLLSAVRMGVNLKIIRDVEIPTVNELFILTQPAHLQKMERSELEGPARDITRATYIRNRLTGRGTSTHGASNGDSKS